MTHWVHDWETLSNCSVIVFEHYKEDITKVFVVHEIRDDRKELIEFLSQTKKNREWHIGFNSLAFDSQITEAIFRDKNFLKISAEEAARNIYNIAQETIQKSNNNEFQKYAEWNLSFEQIDVFKLNHWDNAQRRSSLKWLQFAMDWPNLQEMPIPHTKFITSNNEINEIIEYCINDVRSTKKILHLSKSLLDVRKNVKKQYGLKCYSYSNTKMGSELLLRLYCNATNQDPREVKKYRTYREKIPIKDILFPYIQFETIELQGFLEMLRGKTIVNTKKEFSYRLNYKGYTFDYGAGGIHQCIETGIYKSDEKFIIKDLDVASLYPSIACVNYMYPAHLGEDFFRVYKERIVDVRLAEKNKKKEDRDMAIIEGFKEAANATYGNSNQPNSWLYDPQYTMTTTINGQLEITMLVEKLLMIIPEAQLLQTNTDGATLRFPREWLPEYNQICKDWEKLTKLTLEFADYQAMYIWDVNNYIAHYADGNTKCKGRFEWEDLQNHKVTHLYKNKSHLIVPKAIFNYFINNIPPEKYLIENRNIYDYCAGIKIKGEGWKFIENCYTPEGMVDTPLQSTIRYYISSKGCKILKKNFIDGRTIQTEAGEWLQTIFNKYEKKNWEEYGVDDDYYLKAIYKEIQDILPKKKQQLEIQWDKEL
jgi:hypothetical protein